jgi:hypothetical protein
MLTLKLGDPDTVKLPLDDREGVPERLWDTAADGVTLELELVLSDTGGVTLELGLGLSDTEGFTLELELEEVVALILMLSETAVVCEPLVLELEELVADTLVLSDTSVVGELLELEEVVEDILELEVQDIDSDGELDITKPGDTDTDWDSV